MSCSHS